MFSTSLVVSSGSKDLDRAFPKIKEFYSIIPPDETFLSTLRILLNDRIPEGEVFTFEVFRKFSPEAGEAPINTLFIRLGGESEPDAPKSFRRVSDLEKYCSPICPIKVFINESLRTSFVYLFPLKKENLLAKSSILPIWHFIQGLIPRLLPWYFDKTPLIKEELQFLYSLQKTKADEYLGLIEKYEKDPGFMEKKLISLLQGFDNDLARKAYDRESSRFDQVAEDLKKLLEDYDALLKAKKEINDRLKILYNQMNEPSKDSELIQFFKANPYIELLSAKEGCVSIVVKTVLKFFNQEAYNLAIQRPNSYLYLGGSLDSRLHNPETRKRFLDAIFVDELLKVRIQAQYDVGSNIVEAWTGFSYTDDSYLPNPHIKYYACLGNYAPMMAKALETADYITAIMLCVSSAGSVNLSEIPSASRFIGDLFKSKGKIIELPDGTNVTVSEALDFLISKDGGSANE